MGGKITAEMNGLMKLSMGKVSETWKMKKAGMKSRNGHLAPWKIWKLRKLTLTLILTLAYWAGE